MIVIVATMKAKAGSENDLIASMNTLAQAVRGREPGNLEYIFHRSMKDPTAFLVYEKYADGPAVQAHMASAHFQETAKKFPQLLDGNASIEMYSIVD